MAYQISQPPIERIRQECMAQSKPRIRLRFGIWGCVSRRPGGAGLIAGFGRTPAEAYADWRRRTIATDYTR